MIKTTIEQQHFSFLKCLSKVEIFPMNYYGEKKLPGKLQAPIKHVRTSVKFLLSQLFPPCAGGGLVQFR